MKPYHRRLDVLDLQDRAAYEALVARELARFEVQVPLWYNGVQSNGTEERTMQLVPTFTDLYGGIEDLLPTPLGERARYYALRAQAQTSLKSQETWWRLATLLCARWHTNVLPMDLWTAIAIIVTMADHAYAFGSIMWMVRTIRNAHKYSQLPDPTADERFARILAGIRRTCFNVVCNRKKALLLPQLRTLVQRVREHGERGRYESTILLVLWWSALRASELCALDVEHVRPEGEDLILWIAHSKTDQEGHGAEVILERYAEDALCAVRALAAWSGDRRTGALFYSASRCGNKIGERVKYRNLLRMIKVRSAEAGLDPALFGVHSTRAGYITDALNASVDETRVARQARQDDLRSLIWYYRPERPHPKIAQAIAGLPV